MSIITLKLDWSLKQSPVPMNGWISSPDLVLKLLHYTLMEGNHYFYVKLGSCLATHFFFPLLYFENGKVCLSFGDILIKKVFIGRWDLTDGASHEFTTFIRKKPFSFVFCFIFIYISENLSSLLVRSWFIKIQNCYCTWH